MNNNIRYVLKSCAGIPSGAEARQLARDYKAGDQAAKERLITGNLPMIPQLIERFHVPPRLMDDAFSEGVFGLIRAAEEYDPDHESGCVFCTVAYWWVMHHIQRFLRREIRHRERELTVGFAIDVEVEHDFATSEENHLPLLATLSRRERQAMESVTGNVTQIQIAQEMGVSKQRVQQIKARAIDKLRGMVR
jgi:RNA polymerase sigma factor (sigma-70 family)